MGEIKLKADAAAYSEDMFEENRVLKQSLSQLRTELDRYRHSPLMLCELKEVVGDNAIIRIPNGNQFLVEVSENCSKLKPGDTVLVEQHNLTVVKRLRTTRSFNVEKFVIIEKPEISWKDIGGAEEQIREIREVIELPLKNPQLFEKIGIQPPKGALLYGSPGTGKTLLAKAVANSTNATFIEVVASELVQKFIGEGARLVKEIFQLAREKAPSIIFIDELDALAARRMDIGTSGEREVQRTFMQLLAEIDGFKNLGNVKVIGCTNRIDILDPAIIRPGRLERQIYTPLPDSSARKDILNIYLAQMNVGKVDTDQIIKATDGMSGAAIKAVCTEAGYFAIRESKSRVEQEHFTKAVKKVSQKEEKQEKEYLEMFG